MKVIQIPNLTSILGIEFNPDLDNYVILITGCILAIFGWYIKKIDSRVENTEKTKVDKEVFEELKKDMKKGFDSLHTELKHQDALALAATTTLAVLNEKMSRVEALIERWTRG